MQGRDERSIGDLLKDLFQDLSTLVRQEINLAKTEMTQKASRAGKNVGFLAAGGAVAYAGFLAVLAGIIALLAQIPFVPVWLSALVVGLVVAGVGYFLVRKGLTALQEEEPVPQETVETLKEDREWLRDQTK